VRDALIPALNNWRHPRFTQRLIRTWLSETASEAQRALAMRMFSRWKEREAIRAIARWLGEDKEHATDALLRYGSVAEPEVRPLVHHDDTDMARQACAVLAEIGTTASMRTLLAATRGRDRSVADAARDAFYAIQQRQRDQRGEGAVIPRR